jgi:hypothetical protein
MLCAELCYLQWISLLPNCVVRSELVSLPICVICSEGIFAAELCYLQRISFVAKGVVCNELVSLLI